MSADPEPTDALVERLMDDTECSELLHGDPCRERWPEAIQDWCDGCAQQAAAARLRSMGEPEPQSAAADALDDICVLIGAPAWEYPGQVVRDVAMELEISLDEMAERLKSATPTDEPEEGEDD